MIPRIHINPPANSFFLFGPRGTGKSTYLKGKFSSAIYIDLLESATYLKFSANPEVLEQYIPKTSGGTVIIDEIQRVPQLLNEVHRLMETTKLQFILTGSSSRKLKRGDANLLGGRADILYLNPFTFQELATHWNLQKYLNFGGLPSLYDDTKKRQPEAFLHAYVDAYIKEEVQAEGLVRKMPSFSRFLTTTSFSQGAMVEYSTIARDCGVDAKTIRNYFELLEDLLIGHLVMPFLKKAKRRMIQRPKFYYFDVGVYRTLRPKGPLDTPKEIEGTALETLVFQQLLALKLYYKNIELYYWRTADHKEVDFVLYTEDYIYAIEVKRTSQFRREDTRPLHLFLKDYPMAKAMLLYLGKQELHDGKVDILPIEKGLAQLFQNLSYGL